MSEKLKWFTALDLKDAFFCILLITESQELFAFEWQNPNRERSSQLTWTVLPQQFKNNPTIFGNQWAKELEGWKNQNPTGVLLQYAGDIVIATETKQQCWDQTVALLNFWGLTVDRSSTDKAEMFQTTVSHLGFKILQGQRRLGEE